MHDETSPHSSSAASGGRYGRWPLIWHLVALVVAAFAPAMALNGWLLASHSAEARRQIDRSAVAQAEIWSHSIDQALIGAVAALRALATSPALTSADYEGFKAQCDASFAGTGITVHVRDSDFKLLGAAPAGDEGESERPLSLVESHAALSSNEPYFTGFRDAAAIGPIGIDIWIREAPATQRERFLQARVPSRYLNRSLIAERKDTQWTVALIDRSHRIVAQSRGEVADIGKLRTIAGESDGAVRPAGVTRGTDDNGVPVIEALTAANIAGWRVATSAPRAAVEQQLEQRWQEFFVASLLLGLLTAGATSFVAGGISRSIFGVSANARGLASGAPFAPVNTTISEMQELMDTLSGTRAELSRRQAALHASDHRLRMALDAGRMGVWEWDRVTDEMTWDPVQFDLAGLPRGERPPKGTDFLSRVLDEDRHVLEESFKRLSVDDPAFAVDFRFRRYDGEVRALAGSGLLVSDEGGAPRGLVGINFDVTDQRLNAERTATLLREVSHRSKNMLALILSMARLTARDATDVNAHLRALSARVAGLAASQDLMVEADWQGVDIADLAAAQARAVAHDSADRITIRGPDLHILPEAAQMLGMVLAELTLNAAQHGALTSARGRVDFNWEIAEEQIRMTWRETGGPPAVFKRKGYGMSVVERFAEQGLRASAVVVAIPDGLTWTLDAPLKHIAARRRTSNC